MSYAKPKALKILEGNPGGRPILAEPEPTRGAPLPPEDLSGEALAEWSRIVPELDAVGLLTVVDRAYLVVYCEAWQTYCDARVMMREYGPLVSGRDGNLVKNPAAQVMRDSADVMLKYGSRFGLSPSDRTKLGTTPESPSKGDAQILSLLS